MDAPRNVTLNICFTPQNGGRPITAATVSDHRLIKRAAKLAIDERRKAAKFYAFQDELAGRVKATECERLEDILKELIPDLEIEGACDG